jgi:hypothetical protein
MKKANAISALAFFIEEPAYMIDVCQSAFRVIFRPFEETFTGQIVSIPFMRIALRRAAHRSAGTKRAHRAFQDA